MEHYVLCVWNGTLTEEDKNMFTNYFNTLFLSTNQQQFINDYACNVAILLNLVSKYIAFVNPVEVQKNLEWAVLNEDLGIKDIMSKEMMNEEPNEFVIEDFSEHLSLSLHSLADQLPAFGTYKLDVLIGSNVLKDLSLSKELALSNAFFRLVTWHSAYFSIFLQQKCDQDRLEEWCEILNADILYPKQRLDLGAVLWRGAMQFQCSSNQDNTALKGFELKLDLIANEEKISFYPIKENAKPNFPDHIVLSSKLQVVDEISFASIPPFIKTSVAFRLRLAKPNVLNENSSCFIDYLQNNEKVALIVRLEYAEVNEKIKPDKKYCTSRWQRAVSAGCFKDPECFVSSFKDYITFIITKSRESHHILAYPLMDIKNINPDFLFSMMNCRALSKSCRDSEKKNTDSVENILSNVPFIEASDFQRILRKYSEINMNFSKNNSSQTCITDSSYFSSFWEDIKNSSHCSPSIKRNSTDILFEEIDPSDWPERIQLLCKQMQNEGKRISESALLGQNLKLPQQSFTVSSENVSQFFQPSGEPKDSANVDVLNPLNMDHVITHEFNEVLQMNWPKIMNCIYHDIYYNSTCQSEDKESLGSEMVKLYIQHETASSCNKQQIIQNFSITVPDKHLSPFKEFRSPSCRQANSNQRIKKDCVAFKENSIKDLLTKKVLFSSQASYSKNSNEREIQDEQTVNNNANRKRKYVGNPVRCSPRKKTFVNQNGSVRCSPRKKTFVNQNGPTRCSPRKRMSLSQNVPVKCSPRKKTFVNQNGPTRCSPRKRMCLSQNAPVNGSPRKKAFSASNLVKSSPRKNNVNHNYPSSSKQKDSSKNSKSHMPDLLRKKIRSAVAIALENNGINLNHPFYQPCGSRLFSICQAFLQDLTLKKGKTSEYLQKIADAHVKQVIEFFKD